MKGCWISKYSSVEERPRDGSCKSIDKAVLSSDLFNILAEMVMMGYFGFDVGIQIGERRVTNLGQVRMT